MLMRSISRTEAAPTATASARSRIRPAMRSRSSAVSFLESSTPRMARVSGAMMTAHATTGPARGPRPTSSIPARRGPRESRSSRSRVLQRGTVAPRPVLLGGRAGLGNAHLHFLDARGLAGEMTQVVELGATDTAATDHVDVGQHGAVEGENALHADAVRDLADGERGADAAAPTGDDHSLERLDALLFPFLDAHVHAHGITRAEGGQVGTEPLFLGFDEGMHMTLGAGARFGA